MHSKSKRVVVQTDKVAGLESHQFSRDEHRFAALPVKNLEVRMLPRQPRVGNNSRNQSDVVFKFGNSMAYADPKERYISDVARHEKLRLENKRDKEEKRIELKRVNYNPITCEYHKTEGGRKLAAQDAKAMHHIAMRAARLYVKNNSFDPLLCKDIPRRLDSLGCDAQDAPALPPVGAKPSTQITGLSLSGPINGNATSESHKGGANASHSQPTSDPTKLERPRFGRRSYRILQTTSSSKDLPTPLSLFNVVASTASLVQERTGMPIDRTMEKMAVVVEPESTSWARKF
eukprot:jgi/Hompol1/1302/HPOL_004633-RA